MKEFAALFACSAFKECYAKKGCDFEILENSWVSGDASQYGSWNVKHVCASEPFLLGLFIGVLGDFLLE